MVVVTFIRDWSKETKKAHLFLFYTEYFLEGEKVKAKRKLVIILLVTFNKGKKVAIYCELLLLYLWRIFLLI